MNESTTMAKLFGSISKLKQADLSAECGINRGQLSAYLKGNGSLAEDKQVALIASLSQKIDELSGQGEKLPAEVDGLLKMLEAYPPYQAKHGELEPGSVVLPGHKSYVERTKDILQELQLRPFVLCITGGPKTGKSNLGRGLQYRLRKEQVVYADCKDYPGLASQDSSQFVKWLVRTAADQWHCNFNESPSDWRGVVKWLKNDILRAAPCTFIFDNLALLGKGYQDFSSGWHYVLNQNRREPILDTIGLVLLFDEANPGFITDPASRIEQRRRSVAVQPFPAGTLRNLVKATLSTNDNDSEQLSAHIWELFHGHPYLTHCYIHAYGNAMKNESENAAMQAAQTAFLKGIAPRLLKNIYEVALRRSFNAYQESVIEFSADERSHAMFLQDTLLFTELDNGNLACATLWVQKVLIESITSKK